MATLTVAATVEGLEVVAYLGSRCACKYTPVLFAERSGMRRLPILVEIDAVDRRRFAEEAEERGGLVDPAWTLGRVPDPGTFHVAEEKRAAMADLLERWRRSPRDRASRAGVE